MKLREVGRLFARRAELAGVRKGEQHGGDVIGQRAFVERDAPQNAAGENVEIKRGGNLQAAGLIDDRIVDQIVIENGVALGFVAQQGNEGDGVALAIWRAPGRRRKNRRR